MLPSPGHPAARPAAAQDQECRPASRGNDADQRPARWTTYPHRRVSVSGTLLPHAQPGPTSDGSGSRPATPDTDVSPQSVDDQPRGRGCSVAWMLAQVGCRQQSVGGQITAALQPSEPWRSVETRARWQRRRSVSGRAGLRRPPRAPSGGTAGPGNNLDRHATHALASRLGRGPEPEQHNGPLSRDRGSS